MHRKYHPEYVPDCFGCKVSSLAYDRKHLTTARIDVREKTSLGFEARPLKRGEELNPSKLNAVVTEYRDGRTDSNVFPRPMTTRIAVSEE